MSDADIISAAPHGREAVLSVIIEKIAAMVQSDEDREAILGALTDLSEGKFAAAPDPAAATAATGKSQVLPWLLRGAAGAAMLAGPAAAVINHIAKKRARERAYSQFQTTNADLIQQDPARANAIFDLIHSTAPSIAGNPVVTRDLAQQMMAVPMLDLGTVKGLSEVGKNVSDIPGPSGPVPSINPVGAAGSAQTAIRMLAGVKTSAVISTHVDRNGIPRVFNWGSEAMKSAGITDAFMGSGTNLEQADAAFNLNDQVSGSPLLPLDAVVQELLAKEQELAMREQVIQQREMDLMQAQQMYQGMQSGYADQYGMDPTMGGGPDDGMPPAGGAGMPAAPGMGPAGDPGMPPAGDPGMPPAGDPGMPPAGDPSMGADPGMPPAGDPSMGADPGMPADDPGMPADDPGMPMPPAGGSAGAPIGDEATPLPDAGAPAGAPAPELGSGDPNGAVLPPNQPPAAGERVMTIPLQISLKFAEVAEDANRRAQALLDTSMFRP